MSKIVIALLSALLLAPAAWSQTLGKPIQAQADARPSDVEIHQHLVAGQKILHNAMTMIPKFEFPADGDREKGLAMLASVSAQTRANLPKVRTLIAEAATIPKLASTGDAERDASIADYDQSLKDMLSVLEQCLGAVPAMYDAIAAGDVPKLTQLYSNYMKAAARLSESGAMGIRAAKVEPGSPSKRASIEALALAAEAVQAFATFEAGVLTEKEFGQRLAGLAASIRQQLITVRKDPTFEPPGARQKLLIAYEQVADLLEADAVKLSSKTFTKEDDDAFLPDLKEIDVGQSYNRAWP